MAHSIAGRPHFFVDPEQRVSWQGHFGSGMPRGECPRSETPCDDLGDSSIRISGSLTLRQGTHPVAGTTRSNRRPVRHPAVFDGHRGIGSRRVPWFARPIRPKIPRHGCRISSKAYASVPFDDAAADQYGESQDGPGRPRDGDRRGRCVDRRHRPRERPDRSSRTTPPSSAASPACRSRTG